MNLGAEWFGGTLTPRRLLALVEGLPLDSALGRAENGQAAMWGVSEHLLASLIEAVDTTSWRAVMPHTKKGWKPPKGVEITRPMHGHEPTKRKRKATSDDLKRVFGGGTRYVGGGDST